MSNTTCIPLEIRDNLDVNIHKLRALGQLVANYNGDESLDNFSCGISYLFSGIEDQLTNVSKCLNELSPQ